MLGSSPRMRGTRRARFAESIPRGIIPAYAGNTSMSAIGSPTHWDHPRVCGEHVSDHSLPSLVTGSSPRMRGTRWSWLVICLPPGIIPAYAGNTSCGSGLPLGSRDHPRVCGEHNGEQHESPLQAGSSPRMRGTRFGGWRPYLHAGIIPAYAGNTSDGRPAGTSARDHPRVCGEHDGHVTDVERVLGSSPRMRGTRETFRPVGFPPGIIPAYAGNTKPTVGIVPAKRDHPRVCGEHMTSAAMGNEAAGSSPRMRGTRT